MLIPTPEILRFPPILQRKANPLAALTARIAVKEVVRREHDRTPARVHQCIWKVTGVREVVGAQVKVNDTAVEVSFTT